MSITIVLIIFTLSGIVSTIYLLIKDRKTAIYQLKREKDVSRRMYELAILKELGDRVGYSLDVQQIIDVIINSLHQFIDYSAVSYMLISPEKLIFKIHLERSVNQKFISDIRDRMLGSLSALLDRDLGNNDVKEVISGAILIEEMEDPVRSFFNIPLVIDEKVFGVMTIADTKIGLYKEEDMTILYKIIQQASKAVTSLQGVVKSEQAKLNAMVESMADGIVMTDMDYRVLVANPNARSVIGIKDKKDITIFDFIDNLEGKFDIRGRLEESVKLNKNFESEEILIRDKYYKIFVFPVHNQVNNQKETFGGVVIFHDITSERAIEQLREQFTSMIVHELRSPISGIHKISELLKSGKEKIGKKDYKEYISLINTDSASMLLLINDILDIAKLEAGKFDIVKEPKDIKDIINNRIDFFEPECKDAKLDLNVKYDPALPNKISIDENGIKQVLNNIISNAIKFTKINGFINVFAFKHIKGENLNEEVKKLNSNIHIPFPEEKFKNINDSMIVTVSDSGTGIGQGDMKELFNKFKQLGNRSETSVKGSGLGLAIAKGIIEQHGGVIGAESELGVGSMFYFMLPLQ
jgi:signal transduction histidine kinase/PAS domain-containing protein